MNNRECSIATVQLQQCRGNNQRIKTDSVVRRKDKRKDMTRAKHNFITLENLDNGEKSAENQQQACAEVAIRCVELEGGGGSGGG